jgi:hypothetical protein
MPVSGAARTSHGTSSVRSHIHGSVNGEAQRGTASKKMGTGKIPHTGWKRYSSARPTKYTGAQ